MNHSGTREEKEGRKRNEREEKKEKERREREDWKIILRGKVDDETSN